MIRSGTSKRAVTQWTRQSEPGQGTRYIEIPTDAKVLVVEDSLSRQLKFRDWLSSSAKIVSTVEAALDELKHQEYDWIFLDRDLGFGGFGEDVASVLAGTNFAGRVVIHSANEFGVQLMKKILSDAGVQVEACPFTMIGIVRVETGDFK